MRKKTILFLFFFTLLPATVFPQEQKKLVHSLTHRLYGTKEGLNQSQVFYSFQDSYGYIWFVTHGDVSRFDGKEFRTFTRAELGNGSALIKHVNQYKDIIYFISRDCISLMSPDGRVEKHSMPDDYKTERSWTGGWLSIDHYLYLFNCYQTEEDIAGSHTTFRFDMERKVFEKVEEGLPHGYYYEVNGKALALANGLDEARSFILSDEGQLVPVPISGVAFKKNYHYHSRISSLAGEIFLLERFSGADRKPQSTTVYSCRFSGDTLRCELLCEIADDAMIVQRINETQLLIGQHNYYLLNHDSLSPFPINTLIVNYMMKDRDGNLWLSTEEGVINCHQLLFDSYKLGIKHNDYIWNVCKDRLGNIWFSSYGLGFWKADRNGRLTQAKLFRNGEKYVQECGYMGHAEDRLGRLYLTSSVGIAVFDPRKGNAANLDFYETGVSLALYYDSLARCVYSGGYDHAEDGAYSTLCRVNEAMEIQKFRLGPKHIISICRDANEKLRIGTFHGEYVFDEKNGIFIEDTVQQPYQGVVSMALDKEGYLWKATTNGVFSEDKKGKIHRIWDSEKTVAFLTCYRDKYIIWGAADQLSILDLQAFHQDTTAIRIRTFDGYAGFDLPDCGQNGVYTDHDEYVWVVGGDKVLRFLPDRLMAMSTPSAAIPYLAAVYNTDKEHDWQLVHNKDSLTFENKNNYLRFDLLQASVMAPDQLTFRYRLKGYSEHWTKTSERAIIYQNVSHGKYRFEAQSSIDGVSWSDSVWSSPITIRRPFWLTIPGLLLLFAGVVLILLLLVYWVRKLSIRKQEEKRQMDQLRFRAVQSKFIPHFTGNVLNSINYLISRDPELAQRYIVDFAGFSRQTLLYSDKLLRTLKEELEYIELYLKLEKLRFEDDLNYSIDAEPDIDMKTKVPMMVLQTFCENAMKHGLHHKNAPGFIKVEVLNTAGYVVLAVEDDGIGRAKARELKTGGSGEGLNIVNEQIRFFNKSNERKAFLEIIDLYDVYNRPAGTRFELHLPGG